jgi:hypothetical protein
MGLKQGMKILLLSVIIATLLLPPVFAANINYTDYQQTTYPYDRIFTFTLNDTTQNGYVIWQVPENITAVDYLVVGGGGSGGGVGGGGGGAGGLAHGSATLTPLDEYEIYVGRGAPATAAAQGLNGNFSMWGAITVVGGGGGGVGGYPTPNALMNGITGGSGGGGGVFSAFSSSSPKSSGGSGTIEQGNSGGFGVCYYSPQPCEAGGGGGYISGGGSGSGAYSIGGTGYTSNIDGTTKIYAAGGNSGTTYGSSSGTAGTPFTGNGGNGGDLQASTNGGAGGAGIVIIRTSGNYTPLPTPTPTPPPLNASVVQYTGTHIVRFICQDEIGTPIPNMTMSVIATETTVPFDWIFSMFGINLGNTPLLNTTMIGITDDGGSANFPMISTSKYQVNYDNVENNINETRYYYPSENMYIERFWTETVVSSITNIEAELYNTTGNATYLNLGMTYNDTLSTTTSIYFYVQNASNSTTIYSATYTSGIGTNFTANYTAKINNGQTLYWGYSAVSTSFKTNITDKHFITFATDRFKVDFMGGNKAGLSSDAVEKIATVYNYIAIALIFIFGFIFGRESLRFGVVIVPLMAALFWYFGWLQVQWYFIAIGLVLGVIISFRLAEEVSG